MVVSYDEGLGLPVQDPTLRLSRRPSNVEHRTLNVSERGFTLIELLVVVIIIGLLAALVGPRLFGRVGQSKQVSAQAQIELFGAALDHFRLDTGRYPTTEEGLGALVTRPPGVENWAGPYLKKDIPDDPWGHPYIYRSPGEEGREYEIISYGADGRPGGEGEDQDIVSWRVLKRKEG